MTTGALLYMHSYGYALLLLIVKGSNRVTRYSPMHVEILIEFTSQVFFLNSEKPILCRQLLHFWTCISGRLNLAADPLEYLGLPQIDMF